VGAAVVVVCSEDEGSIEDSIDEAVDICDDIAEDSIIEETAEVS